MQKQWSATTKIMDRIYLKYALNGLGCVFTVGKNDQHWGEIRTCHLKWVMLEMYVKAKERCEWG